MPRRPNILSMEFVLLALLERKSMHGYDLYQTLTKTPGISKIWTIKQPLFYSYLEKLEKYGFIHAIQEEGETHLQRNRLELTADGKEALDEWLSTPVRRPRDFRQELLAKMIIARWRGKEELLGLIEDQMKALRNWSKEVEFDEIPNDAWVDDWFVTTHKTFRLDSYIKWLETCKKVANRV
ncbi:MAG TPA: PadR family transcriptional regulator [Bellilinea sp.]|nr:PadR family transcriptional regulator [Bellilinea sp.]